MSADNGVRVCGVSDQLGQGGDCRWPDGNIPWTITAVIPGFTFERMKAVAETAFARLAAVCGITPRYTDTARDARILLGTANMDGSGGVLADSMLPCGNTRQCRQRYDTGEKWTVDDGRAAGKIDLTRVMAHEIMHALGVGHLAQGSANLIAPTYSQTIIGPQAGDIAELRRRYGPPKAKPVPPATPTVPIPTPGGDMFQTVLKQLLLGFVKTWLEKAIADGSLTKILTDLLGGLNTGQLTTADEVVAHVMADSNAQAVTQQMVA